MTWFRFHSDWMHNPTIQSLRPELFKFWVNLLCLANIGQPRGRLPDDAAIARTLRVRTDRTARFLAELRACGLLETDPSHGLVPANWDSLQACSDSSASRDRRYRERLSVKSKNSDLTVSGRQINRDAVTTELNAQDKLVKRPLQALSVTSVSETTDCYETGSVAFTNSDLTVLDRQADGAPLAGADARAHAELSFSSLSSFKEIQAPNSRAGAGTGAREEEIRPGGGEDFSSLKAHSVPAWEEFRPRAGSSDGDLELEPFEAPGSPLALPSAPAPRCVNDPAEVDRVARRAEAAFPGRYFGLEVGRLREEWPMRWVDYAIGEAQQAEAASWRYVLRVLSGVEERARLKTRPGADPFAYDPRTPRSGARLDPTPTPFPPYVTPMTPEERAREARRTVRPSWAKPPRRPVPDDSPPTEDPYLSALRRLTGGTGVTS